MVWAGQQFLLELKSQKDAFLRHFFPSDHSPASKRKRHKMCQNHKFPARKKNNDDYFLTFFKNEFSKKFLLMNINPMNLRYIVSSAMSCCMHLVATWSQRGTGPPWTRIWRCRSPSSGIRIIFKNFPPTHHFPVNVDGISHFFILFFPYTRFLSCLFRFFALN